MFDRAVEKFKDVLLVEDIDVELIRDGLKTLNELIHNVETGDVMVE